MIPSREKSGIGTILENIIFLADVFAEMTDEEIPDVPFLELAKSFELKSRGDTPATMHQRKKRSRNKLTGWAD